MTIAQANATLTGSIQPVASRATPLGGSVSATEVYFGSETPYWNDISDAYFRMQLDSTGRRMTGTCNNMFTCTSVTATKVSQ